MSQRDRNSYFGQKGKIVCNIFENLLLLFFVRKVTTYNKTPQKWGKRILGVFLSVQNKSCSLWNYRFFAWRKRIYQLICQWWLKSMETGSVWLHNTSNCNTKYQKKKSKCKLGVFISVVNFLIKRPLTWHQIRLFLDKFDNHTKFA